MTEADLKTDLILQGRIARRPVTLVGRLEGGDLKEISGCVTLNASLSSILRDLGVDYGEAAEVLKQLVSSGKKADIVLEKLGAAYRGGKSGFVQVGLIIKIGDNSCQFALLKGMGDKKNFIVGVDLRSDKLALPRNFLSGIIGDISIRNLGVYYASETADNVPFVGDDAFQDATQLPLNIPQITGRDFPKGLSFSAEILVGGINLFALDKPGVNVEKSVDSKEHTTTDDTKAVEDAELEKALSKGLTKWIKVDKTIGPLSVRRVGLSYEAPRVGIKFDAGLQLSCLTFSLEGMGLSYPLDKISKDPKEIWKNLQFHLDGAAVAFEQGPLTISGGLLKVEVPDKAVSLRLDGFLLIRTEVFTITALGSYANLDGTPSFFMFAALQKELGGPAFFFVTGLAFGFGVNRALKLPAITEVHNFPLVKAATDADYLGKNMDLQTISQKLGDHIYPSEGNYWIAAGVKFTSFGMINSFALISVSFGAHFQIGLLGLSRITVPVQIPGAPAVDPVACAELALKVTFTLTTGVLAVEARVTDNSFIFTRRCRLTGGFAFYCWFGPQHEGDFVVTLGGYHPRFIPPQHYPLVPRLGMNWSVSSHLSVTGEIYFALTPSCLMAGGKLNAVFQVGNLRAWFYAYADFVINWKPFYYDIAIGVSIGVSYRITFLGINKTFSIELGASVHLWGPPFGGIAHVTWYIISFDICLGKRKIPVPPPISWDEFHKSFLPQQQNCQASKPVPEPVVGVIRITGGLIQEQEKGEGNGKKATFKVVNAHEFSFTTESLIPSTRVQWNGKDVAGARNGQPAVLGIRPMGISNLESTHAVTVEKKTRPTAGWDAYLEPSLTQKSVPYALWSNDLSRPDHPSAKKIDGVPSGMRVSLRNREPSHGLESIELEKFKYEIIYKHIDWREFKIPGAIPAPGKKTLMNTIWNNPAVNENRNAILQALGQEGLQLQKIELPELAANAREIFQSEPDMAVLGEAFKKPLD